MTASRSCNITSICDGNFTRLYCVLLILTRTLLTNIQQIYFALLQSYSNVPNSTPLTYSNLFYFILTILDSTLLYSIHTSMFSTLFFLSLILLYPNLPDLCNLLYQILLYLNFFHSLPLSFLVIKIKKHADCAVIYIKCIKNVSRLY